MQFLFFFLNLPVKLHGKNNLEKHKEDLSLQELVGLHQKGARSELIHRSEE